jgi:hypothetical protein
MSRHDERLYDDESPEQRTQRVVYTIMKSRGIDKFTARLIVKAYAKELSERVDPETTGSDYLLRRIILKMLFMNENEKSRVLHHMIWLKNTR